VLKDSCSCSTPRIAPTPASGSSPQARAGLDILTSQPWSEATCLHTTSSRSMRPIVTLFSLRRQKKSNRRGGTGVGLPQTMVGTSYSLDLVVPEGMNQLEVQRRSEVCNINGVLRLQHPAISWHFRVCGNLRMFRGPLQKLLS